MAAVKGTRSLKQLRLFVHHLLFVSGGGQSPPWKTEKATVTLDQITLISPRPHGPGVGFYGLNVRLPLGGPPSGLLEHWIDPGRPTRIRIGGP